MSSILITGSSKGIGRELAIQLIQANHKVWGIARHEEKLIELDLYLHHPDFFYSVCDVSKPLELQNLITQMEAKGFKPDVLILNAGVTSSFPKQNHEINYEGVVNTWNTFKTGIKDSGGIVAVSGSLFAMVQAPFNISYSRSKSDTFNFIKNLSEEKSNQAVVFTYFVLGPIHTQTHKSLPFWKSLFIPSAANTAKYIIRHLRSRQLIVKFPLSSDVMTILSTTLPDRLMIFLIMFLKKYLSVANENT